MKRNRASDADVVATWEALDVDQSTERLTQQVADTLGISYEAVVDAMMRVYPPTTTRGEGD